MWSSFLSRTKRQNKITVIIPHSALQYILSATKECILRLKKHIEVLSQYAFKVKFFKDKDMIVCDFLSRHPVHNLVSQNEIIQISFLSRDLLDNSDNLTSIIEALEVTLSSFLLSLITM